MQSMCRYQETKGGPILMSVVGWVNNTGDSKVQGRIPGSEGFKNGWGKKNEGKEMRGEFNQNPVYIKIP